MHRRRVLLTGASGFIGRALVPELLGRGFMLRALRHQREVPSDVAEVVDGSLARGAEYRLSVEGVHAVVHSAALLDPIEDERRADEINHLATLELARAAARAGARTFVFLSSAAVFGHRHAGLVGSDADCYPTTAYARSKLAAERSLGQLAAGQMRIVILRPPTVYGPGERRNFLALVRGIDTGFFAIPGDGRNRLSFCAVRNLAHAVGFCLTTENVRGIVHVADEPVATFRESVDTISRALGKRILRIPFPLPIARATALGLELAFHFSRRTPPLTRARLRTLTSDTALDTRSNARFGLSPVTSFSDAVAETIAEYRRSGLVGSR